MGGIDVDRRGIVKRVLARRPEQVGCAAVIGVSVRGVADSGVVPSSCLVDCISPGRGILYAQVKLTLVPTLSTRVVFAIPIAVFDLKVIPDNLMVWLDTWLLAAGAWLFGAWLHI